MNSKSTILENDELIRAKAYELWQSRGGGFGDPNLDWYEAQKKLVEAYPPIEVEIIEKEELRSDKLSRYNPIDPVVTNPNAKSEPMLQYNPIETFVEQVTDLQKGAYEIGMSFTETLSDFDPTDYRSNLKKSLKTQQILITNWLECQGQLTRMYVDTQKQFWTEYYEFLKKWW